MKPLPTVTPELIDEVIKCCYAEDWGEDDSDKCDTCPLRGGLLEAACTIVINFSHYSEAAEEAAEAGDTTLLRQEIIEDKCDALYQDLLKVKELTDEQERNN